MAPMYVRTVHIKYTPYRQGIKAHGFLPQLTYVATYSICSVTSYVCTYVCYSIYQNYQ